MKTVRIFLLLLLFILSKSSFTIAQKQSIKLFETEEIKAVLEYEQNANITLDDWLNIKVTNKTNSPIKVYDIKYSFYAEKGIYGEGEAFQILAPIYAWKLLELPDIYYDQSDSINISANSSWNLYRHLSCVAGSAIECNIENKKEVCLPIEFKLTIYEQAYKLKELTANERVCIDWTNSKFIEKKEVIEKTKKELTSKWQSEENISLAHYLYKSVKDEISDSFYTEAIIQLEYPFTFIDVDFLQRITKLNNRSTEKLGQYYSRKINLLSRYGNPILRDFWHDELLNALFKSELSGHQIAEILELHNEYWSQKIENRKTVYDSLSSKFDFDSLISHPNLHPGTWTSLVKIMAISRDDRIIGYLTPFLDDTTSFVQINRYTNEPVGTASSARKRNPPIKLNTRKCDVAFVALLRALNQVEYIPNNYYLPSIKLSDDFSGAKAPFYTVFLPKNVHGQFKFIECWLKLSDEYREKLNQLIEQRR